MITAAPTSIDVTCGAVVDPARYRKAVALFATGIAVVTVTDSTGATHGATVNSFTSVSLKPPTVLVSLVRGQAHRLISLNGWYGVSVLSSEQRSHSSHFGGRHEIEWEPDLVQGHKVATLKGSLARFECKVMSMFPVHDHTLFVARVMWCDAVDAAEGSPLMFFSSSDSYVLRGE